MVQGTPLCTVSVRADSHRAFFFKKSVTWVRWLLRKLLAFSKLNSSETLQWYKKSNKPWNYGFQSIVHKSLKHSKPIEPMNRCFGTHVSVHSNFTSCGFLICHKSAWSGGPLYKKHFIKLQKLNWSSSLTSFRPFSS